MPAVSMRGPEWGKESTNVDELELRHKHVLCWPSFEAIRQYEWIRVGGQFNMITEMRQVQETMLKLGFFDALEWLETCRENKIFFGALFGDAVEFYKKERPGNWFDKEFVQSINRSKKRELESKLRQLQAEIDEMEDT